MLNRLIRRRSSIADKTPYTSFCREASQRADVFATFRRAPVYNQILEHTTEAQGSEYLDVILRRYAHLAEHFEAFRGNDRVGAPRTFEYGEHGAFSPTTLRYIKVLGDLERLFGDLGSMHFVEIGVGYGGQCRIIDAYGGFGSYCLVDLAPCLDLAHAYLDEFETTDAVRYCTMEDIDEALDGDLLLSNYAFSECTRAIQQTYLEKVLLRCARGYLTGNAISPARFRSFTQAELLDRLPDAAVEPEDPKTHDGNYVVVWPAASTNAAVPAAVPQPASLS
ncbi:MAG: putative sugar O-methyltransferase [Gaiellaceae bacterium]